MISWHQLNILSIRISILKDIGDKRNEKLKRIICCTIFMRRLIRDCFSMKDVGDSKCNWTMYAAPSEGKNDCNGCVVKNLQTPSIPTNVLSSKRHSRKRPSRQTSFRQAGGGSLFLKSLSWYLSIWWCRTFDSKLLKAEIILKIKNELDLDLSSRNIPRIRWAR